jgi:hypothetical protein
MTPLADKLPTMTDPDLKALRLNAVRLSESGSPTKMATAAEPGVVRERHGIFVDGTDLDQWEQALSKPTQAVFFETPSNPMQSLVDIAAVSEMANCGGMYIVEAVPGRKWRRHGKHFRGRPAQ